jgi:CyaY protein
MISAAASQTPDAPASSALSDAEYHRLTSALLAAIEATVDRWLQEDVIDIDSHRTGGLLELSFPNRSKIVLNTQPPLHELWLASQAGGFHYRWNGGHWRDTRDGSDFFEALSREASTQGGTTLRFSA